MQPPLILRLLQEFILRLLELGERIVELFHKRLNLLLIGRISLRLHRYLKRVGRQLELSGGIIELRTES